MVWKPKVKIGYQTWIFVFSPDLWLHLLITSSGKVVIFYDITNSEKNTDYLNQSPSFYIWFSVVIN